MKRFCYLIARESCELRRKDKSHLSFIETWCCLMSNVKPNLQTAKTWLCRDKTFPHLRLKCCCIKFKKTHHSFSNPTISVIHILLLGHTILSLSWHGNEQSARWTQPPPFPGASFHHSVLFNVYTERNSVALLDQNIYPKMCLKILQIFPFEVVWLTDYCCTSQIVN